MIGDEDDFRHDNAVRADLTQRPPLCHAHRFVGQDSCDLDIFSQTRSMT